MMQEKRLAGPEGRRERREPCSGPARRILGDTVKAGALSYDRERDLPRLIRCDPNRDMEESAEAAEAIMLGCDGPCGQSATRRAQAIGLMT